MSLSIYACADDKSSQTSSQSDSNTSITESSSKKHTRASAEKIAVEALYDAVKGKYMYSKVAPAFTRYSIESSTQNGSGFRIKGKVYLYDKYDQYLFSANFECMVYHYSDSAIAQIK